jgi:hypothetical protein
LFLETHSRMPSLQESLGPFSPLMGGRKSLQEQKGAYVPHSHKLTFLFSFFYLLFLISISLFFVYDCHLLIHFSVISVSLFSSPLFRFPVFDSCYFFFLYLHLRYFVFLCLIPCYFFFLYLPLFFPLFLSQSLSFPSSVRDFILETGSARQKFNSNQRT